VTDGRAIPRWFRTNATTLRRTGEPMPPSDLLSALLDPVRAATPKDGTQALDQRDAPTARAAPPLVDKRTPAHTLGEPSATVVRPCRQGHIPYVHVGDIVRFDPETVRAAPSGDLSRCGQCTTSRSARGRGTTPLDRRMQHRRKRLVPASAFGPTQRPCEGGRRCGPARRTAEPTRRAAPAVRGRSAVAGSWQTKRSSRALTTGPVPSRTSAGPRATE
jgi:hypothetical protein